MIDAVDVQLATGRNIDRIEPLRGHRTDHMVAIVHTAAEPLLVKGFLSTAEFTTEVAAYRRLDGEYAPRLVTIDQGKQFIVTELADGKRLRDLRGESLRASLDGVPALFAAMSKLDVPSSLADPRERVRRHVLAIAQVGEGPDSEGLPDSSTVAHVLNRLPMTPTHGDLQPDNVLIHLGGPVAVDFESAGPGLALLDVVRMAFNPLLRIDDHERDALAEAMLKSAGPQIGATGRRELAAAAVCWAAACAVFFRKVELEGPVSWRDDARILATEPLRAAAELWNRA